MKNHYDNSDRLEGVTDKEWREALDEVTAYLRWRLQGKTKRGAHCERELGQHLLAADGDVVNDGCVVDGITGLYWVWIVEDFDFDAIDFKDVARFGDLLRNVRCFQRCNGSHGFLEAAFFTLVRFLNPFFADEIIA